jgi:hypothetical protein
MKDIGKDGLEASTGRPWGPKTNQNVGYNYESWWLVGLDGRDYKPGWLVVKQEEAGDWLMDVFYWEAWDGADALPGPRGQVVDMTKLLA